MAKKWLDSIEKQRRIDVKEALQTNKHTNRQSQRQKIVDSYARRGVNRVFPLLVFLCITRKPKNLHLSLRSLC